MHFPGWLHDSTHPDTAENHIRQPELDEVASTQDVCRKYGDEPPKGIDHHIADKLGNAKPRFERKSDGDN